MAFCIGESAVRSSFAADVKKGAGRLEQPVTVNGDTVEYSTDQQHVSATGNVVVKYGDSTLTSDKITVDTRTKDVTAEGTVRIENPQARLEGSQVYYNLNTKSGKAIDGTFVSEPFYGIAREIKMVSEDEFIAYDGYVSSCSMDKPDYRIRMKRVRILPQEKIQTYSDTVRIKNLPIAYLPYYSQSLKDPFMHVRFVPGRSKDWGEYLLSAWRSNLMPGLDARIYLDYRSRLGMSEGAGANFRTEDYGKGDYKFYYTQERDRELLENQPGEFERSLVRLRHQWQIADSTSLTTEFYRITDSKRANLGSEHNFLKDYFYREYEKDALPLSYTQLHQSFGYSTIDTVVQKRVNRWYSQLEKLPEVSYSLPSIQLAQTPFYFSDSSSFSSLNYKNAVPSPASADVSMNRLDTTNKLSLPSRVAFFNLTPYAGMRQTLYDRDIDGRDMWASPRNQFLTGADVSTKFYRIFDVQSNAFGLDINGLRHVITPTVGYNYLHTPTEPTSRLKQLDAVDAVAGSNSALLELDNRLQTKRNKSTVDLAYFKLASQYFFKSGGLAGSYLGDITGDLEIKPYTRVRFDADATYSHRYDYFSGANYDFYYDFGPERSLGVGQRYQRKGGNEITGSFNYRLTPKWKFFMYQRYQLRDTDSLEKGFGEQEFTLSRDLHCWLMDVSYSVDRDEGSSIWLIFRLKAFPETEFSISQSYKRRQSGAN
jgi:lipopolysaccharide assembly outer membrane protein LptD (OstA)